MKQSQLYNILDSVDSTNNYAMGKVHEGMATHGMAWFAHAQTAGKGQRGKEWKSETGKNVLLSIVMKPTLAFRSRPFCFSAFIALCCHEVLTELTTNEFFIKWPNDLYWRDRKAGGILIENNFLGTEWKWAVAGIGINVNQTDINNQEFRAVSLGEIANDDFDPVAIGALLHEHILRKYEDVDEHNVRKLVSRYNQVLYKRGQEVQLRKNFAVFQTTIEGVNEMGQLVTADKEHPALNFGGVEWIL